VSVPPATREVQVAMRDGARLVTDVTVADDGAPHPTLLVRTPYPRDMARDWHDPIALASRGWAVVVQTARGLFGSEGDFRPFHQEINDGADAVAWCRSQTWSNGHVAMSGPSYVGATQWLAAMAQPPGLDAIAPQLTGSGFRDGWTYEGGAFAHGFVSAWAAAFSTLQADQTAAQEAMGHVADLATFLETAPAQSPLRRLWPLYDQWLRYDDADYWEPVQINRHYSRLSVPAFHVGGWYDAFRDGTLQNYTGMTEAAATPRARRLQRLVVGPWAHHAPWQREQGELDFGPAATGPAGQSSDTIVDWLGEVLSGGDQVETGPVVFVMGANHWRALAAWPPASTPRSLHLGASGVLLDVPSQMSESTSLEHDPANPVRSCGGNGVDPLLLAAGPREQRDVEGRSDVLCFTTAVFEQPETLIGEVNARLTVSASTASADVVATLCDVHPDGRSFNILTGIRRQSFTPGRPTDVHVLLGSTAIEIGAGHRLRLQVAASNFPRYDVNPATASRLTIHHGGPARSFIQLPQVDS
jgi:putative CocE/NonD family hydrolase